MGNVFRKPEQRQHWYEYNSKYAREHYKTVCIKLSFDKDKELIDYLDANKDKTASTVFKEALRGKINNGR